MTRLFLLIWLWALLAPQPSPAEIPVSVELVLAVDTSASVNASEYALQMRGIAAAFRAPAVIDAIVAQDGVAVALVQWAGWVAEDGGISWRLLTDRASVLAFATEVEVLNRQDIGAVTAIGSAIAAATDLIVTNGYDGRQLKIDISGDGQNNAGLPLEGARRQARSLGITINGLAILTDVTRLDDYFRRQVIVGDGAFVVSAADYTHVADAMRIKLLRELKPPGLARSAPAGRDPRPLQAASRSAAGSSRSTSASQ